jgi:hypothetical protein
MDADLTNIAGRMAPVTGMGRALIRADTMVRIARLRAGTDVLGATGADHGAIAATRRITAGCPVAAGSKLR